MPAWWSAWSPSDHRVPLYGDRAHLLSLAREKGVKILSRQTRKYPIQNPSAVARSLNVAM
jgi:hypothetical protein